ncbi:UNVERIFIED_CONTAM: hypothetical protein Sradi_3428900 [Sesamum radiatum]|uniref:Uncharacterized protein n=1 Tax=Sesamum radiatum TaxID=300843 RepID=A0AAW2R4I2_SESRA
MAVAGRELRRWLPKKTTDAAVTVESSGWGGDGRGRLPENMRTDGRIKAGGVGALFRFSPALFPFLIPVSIQKFLPVLCRRASNGNIFHFPSETVVAGISNGNIFSSCVGDGWITKAFLRFANKSLISD